MLQNLSSAAAVNGALRTKCEQCYKGADQSVKFDQSLVLLAYHII